MTTITYTSGQRQAVWKDGIVNGDELLVQLLGEAAVLAPHQRLSETGPDVMPELVTEGGAWAAGIYLGFDMDASQIPDVLQVPSGATDGYTPPDVGQALKRRAIVKHLAGTANDHDQSTHGRRGSMSTYGSKLVDEAIVERDQWNDVGDKVAAFVAADTEGAWTPFVEDLGWRPGTDSEKWDVWDYAINGSSIPVPEELADLVEHEGLLDESKHEFWQRHATRRVLDRMKGRMTGRVEPQWEQKLADSLDTVKMHLDGSQVFIRADEYAVNQMMVDGAIFNQIGSGVSNGAYGPEQRMGVQEILFGIDEWDEDLDRVPIYGYAAPTPFGDVGSVGHYGEVAIELNHNYKDSTTVTLGDSLDSSGAKGASGHGGRFSHHFEGLEGNYADLAAYPMTAPGVGLLDNLTNRGLHSLSQTPGSPRGFTRPPLADDPLGGWLDDIGNNYVEAQIHKPIDFDPHDIKAIHVEIYSVPENEHNYANAAGGEAVRDYGIVKDSVHHGVPVNVWHEGEVVAVSGRIEYDDGYDTVFWKSPPL